MKARLAVIWCAVVVHLLLAESVTADVRYKISLPDILGYKTLKCDFHMHTVFSDGSVWPTVRVDEAWREGLDAIAITDHIEIQSHKEDVSTKHNRPYEIAVGRAKEMGILLVRGAEITRDTPPGHFNAVFLKDVTRLDKSDFSDVMRLANDQGGFVFWNHPGWQPRATGWFDIHTTLYENKWFHGIEVANGATYYPEAHAWCLEKKLTMMGNSDIHQPAVERRTSPAQHRTLTLVFAKDKSITALKEALVNGRTAVWYQNQLIGKQEYLDAIFKASVHIAKPHHWRGDKVWVEIDNISDVDIEMERVGKDGPARATLTANATTLLKTSVNQQSRQVELSYVARNLLIGPKTGLPVRLIIRLP